MTVHVVYRSYGSENAKGRPDWYSKSLALHSLVRAAEAAGCEVVFLNNGPIPEHLLAVMRTAGEIVDLPGVSMRRSFHAALRLPRERGWADDDVVYFCEDDYLHLPDALTRLQRVAEEVPADYYALYGRHRMVGGPDDGEWSWNRCPDPARPSPEPRGWEPRGPVEVDGMHWVRFTGTTATFGARVRAIRADLPIFLQAGLPHRRMFRDRDIALTYQGYRPHSWRLLLQDLTLRGGGSARQRVRRAWLVPFKTAMNLRALRLPRNRRLLMGAAPNLAAHLENGVLPAGRDWAAAAADTAAWAAARAGAPQAGAGGRVPEPRGAGAVTVLPTPRPATAAVADRSARRSV
ncbi:MAG: hypothetical protein NTW05_24055 [Pseudonocardiales bacterium]|nr:hypothetical protein [Pseudonocardiales bacterium]